MEIKGAIFYVWDSKGKGHLGKNCRRGGTGSDLHSQGSPVANWGWMGKNGGCQTSWKTVAVIKLFSFKVR